MSTHNIGFYEDLTKIIFELSSNSHLISSAEFCKCLIALKVLENLYKVFHHSGSLNRIYYLSLVVRKLVFGGLRPGPIQTGLYIHR